MKLQLRYFASLRERLGTSAETCSWPADQAAPATVGELRAWLRARGGVWAEALDAGRAVRAAVNHNMVDEAAALADGAEVAFFPPVTGG